MNCKQAQRDIALWAGHDLDDPTQKESVRRHVTACPCCRTHYQQMKRTLLVLERAERPATYVSEDSLWPVLASRISLRHSQHHPSRLRNTNRFNGWMPFVAMTAACFILLLVVNEQPQSHHAGPTQRALTPAPVFSEAPSFNRYQMPPDRTSADRRDSVEEQLRRLKDPENLDQRTPF